MSHLEIHLAYSRAGFRSWSVMLDGAHHLKTFFSKHEAAAAAAEQLSRRMHLTIRGGSPSAERLKRAAFLKRQRVVARRGGES
jgi:hypothetical protein